MKLTSPGGIALVIVALIVALIGGRLLQMRLHERSLQQRLAAIDSHIAAVRIDTSSCGATECTCRILGGTDAFTGCSRVAGHLALFIRPGEEECKQWLAIRHQWTGDEPRERIGMDWINSGPRPVANGWSVVQLLQCVD